MNSLRLPVTLLVIVIVLFGGWFLYVHSEAAAPQPTPQAPATTAAPTAIQTSQSGLNPAPALNEAAVATNINGVWQSTDDPSYSVDITSSGKWTDDYKEAGATTTISETGTYTFFTSANPDPDFSGPLASGVVYLKLVEGPDTYFYSVLEATNNQLQLSYLARGNTLSFVRVQ